MMREDKQLFLYEFTKLLQMTSSFGDDLVDLKYFVDENQNEIVRPIFKNGAGSDGYYDINVNCDSCSAMIGDIYKQFICKF